VLNYRTTMDEMQTLLDDVRRVCPASSTGSST
jgi:hypothetical protein